MKIKLSFLSLLLAFLNFVPACLYAMPFLPDFSAATFIPGASVDHPYFPLVTGVSRTYEGQRDKGWKLVT